MWPIALFYWQVDTNLQEELQRVGKAVHFRFVGDGVHFDLQIGDCLRVQGLYLTTQILQNEQRKKTKQKSTTIHNQCHTCPKAPIWQLQLGASRCLKPNV